MDPTWKKTTKKAEGENIEAGVEKLEEEPAHEEDVAGNEADDDIDIPDVQNGLDDADDDPDDADGLGDPENPDNVEAKAADDESVF
jgi:hypothetical protein